MIADLIIAGKHYGPHGFLMDFRRNGKVTEGVVLGDMGLKTTGNDLDNAWIEFQNVRLPKSCLLSRYCEIRDNKYVQTTKERMRIEIIGRSYVSGHVSYACLPTEMTNWLTLPFSTLTILSFTFFASFSLPFPFLAFSSLPKASAFSPVE